MDELASALEWLSFAENDFGSAEFLLNRRPLPKEIICFLCQQAAEKALKGFLVFQKIIPPKIHDLKKLNKECISLNQEFAAVENACAELNDYGVQPRYPHELEIEQEDVTNALKHTQIILAFVKPLIKK
ncbi:DNA-binding protein [Candidatus Termititenax persephonae]|uniref:DNA-binding protein n=1 Tax=Candidatus Termititenax persephonae TaxID=2218525 RepID=A0A388TIQ1_9BACT|nr:DNA-binding protein [Candidatus Termititenax persephonae]